MNDDKIVEIPSLGEVIQKDMFSGERFIPATIEETDITETHVIIKDVIYTAQDCIDDLVRVAEENPEQLTITRDFYRNQSNIPEKAWTAHFGNYAEFQRQAGLKHTRYANKLRNQAARHAAVDDVRRLTESRKDLDRKYQRESLDPRFKTMIACSDLHDIECDPFYLRVLIETIKDVQPDVVCLNGDIFDLPEFGKYSVDPREWDVVGRINAGLDIVRKIREAAPDSQIDFIEGNHEARVIKHLIECSPAIKHLLYGLHDFDIPKLFKLDEYEVNYVANADLHTFTDAQLRKEMIKNYKVYWGCILAHHFPEGRNRGFPGFHGHHHKHLVWSEYDAKFGSYEWHQLGAGHKRVASYCDGSLWNNGFMIATADTKTMSVDFNYVSVLPTFSRPYVGKFYARNTDEFYPTLIAELDSIKEYHNL